jgi:uncharacterized protein (DUF362 family)
MADSRNHDLEASNERAVAEAIENDTRTSRRTFLTAAAATAAMSASLLQARTAEAGPAPPKDLAASPPAGFTPFNAPGRIVKVSKADCLMPNKVYPKADDAKAMLTRALTELTGKGDLVEAVKQFVHPADKVCVKVNGIAEKNFGTNKELVLPFIEAMIASGVPAENITVLEQYNSFLAGTRINASNVPPGVKTAVHTNSDATMDERMIPGTGVKTKFVRVLTESTCAINFSLIKDHSICGYTGLLKNMTHGCQILPHYFHTHHASPQIALLYAQDIIKSRVRLCITDGFKVMAHGGPLYKQPQYCYPHEAVYATTDAVAMDTIGAEIIDKVRVDKGLRTLAAEGRPAAYIKAAADLGLGIGDRAQIQVKEITI